MFPELPMDALEAAHPETLIAMEFTDESAFEAALDTALDGYIPFDVLGNNTLLLVAGQESAFAHIPHKPSSRIRNTSEFTPEQYAKLHRKHYFPL